jgi:hypothetical protein
VVRKLEPFKQMLVKHTPRLDAGVGVYFSMSSCVDTSLNRVDLASFSDKRTNMDFRHNAILDEVLGTGEVLNKMHIPYEIITDSTEDISRFEAIIVNNARYMTPEECERLRKFVSNGGTLIATGKTSLCDRFGNTTGNFALSDVLGVSATGVDSQRISYLAFEDDMILSDLPAPLVKATGAKVKGVVNLPDFPVDDPELYASIHSNPPGRNSEYAGYTVNTFGKGKAVYIYSSFLTLRQYTQQTFAKKIFTEYLPQFVVYEENLPGSAEVTKLKSADGKTILTGIVNYQDELPNLPLHNVKITLKLDNGFTPDTVRRASDGKECCFSADRNLLTLETDRLGDGEIFEISSK